MSNRPSMCIGSVPHILLKLFAYRGGMPGYTTGEMITAAGLHPGTAAHQRMSIDLIGKGWGIKKYKDDQGVQRYWMPLPERNRAKKFLRLLSRQHINRLQRLAQKASDKRQRIATLAKGKAAA